MSSETASLSSAGTDSKESTPAAGGTGLIEALGYISRYQGKIFVIKYGGSAMSGGEPAGDRASESFAQDVTLLKKIGIKIVVVHGGGREVTAMLEKLCMPTRFINGQRYTDDETMKIVEMMLAGSINKSIVSMINKYDGMALGISGVDGALFQANYVDRDTFGNVGHIKQVNVELLRELLTMNCMPVIAPIGIAADGRHLNVNADLAAASVASALKAEKLVYLSDVPGVMSSGELIPTLTEEKAHQLIASGTVTNGMIPKIRAAFEALRAGVDKVHIIDGKLPHSLLLEIFTKEGIGTELIPTETNGVLNPSLSEKS
ncbi:MAG: acetylglutamate kinase [Bacteroidota bacterium]